MLKTPTICHGIGTCAFVKYTYNVFFFYINPSISLTCICNTSFGVNWIYRQPCLHFTLRLYYVALSQDFQTPHIIIL